MIKKNMYTEKLDKSIYTSKLFISVSLFVLIFLSVSFINENGDGFIERFSFMLRKATNLCVVIYPYFILVTLMINRFFTKNTELILRMKNKRKFIFIQVKQMLSISTVIALCTAIYLYILMNLTSVNKLNFADIFSNYAVGICKVYASILLLNIICIYLCSLSVDKKVVVGVMFLIIFAIYYSEKFAMLEFWYLMPATYIHVDKMFKTEGTNLLASIAFYACSGSLMYMLFKINRKMDILEEKSYDGN
ncbi:MAG: hypothetical protein RR988_03740 [Clostridia bacterium]